MLLAFGATAVEQDMVECYLRATLKPKHAALTIPFVWPMAGFEVGDPDVLAILEDNHIAKCRVGADVRPVLACTQDLQILQPADVQLEPKHRRALETKEFPL